MRCQRGSPTFAERGELWLAEEIGEPIAFASGGGNLDATN
jgi:hypothetical protein